MAGERKRPVTKKDIAELRRKVKGLEKEIKELKQAFYDYTSEPRKAMLEFFGISKGERVFTKDGMGVEYAKITEQLHSGEEEKTE